MTGWIIETLVATTLLMGLVLLLRERVAMKFGARAAYMLWLLPALRMILPPLPENFGPPPLSQLPVIVDISDFVMPAGPVAQSPVEAAFPWATAFLALWLAGTAVHLGWHLIAYRRFVRFAMRDRIDLPELDARGIEVCASKAVDGPFASGIFVPTIVLPHDYRNRYTPQEFRLAMRHESIHHDRGDLSINLLALAVLSLHWFNPVAHRAWRAFRTDQELACDAIVLDGASREERHSYGLALVKSACRNTPVAACSLNPRDQLKRRLRMMDGAIERRHSGRILAGLLVAAGLALTASGGIAAETTREIRREVTERVIAPAAQVVGVTPSAPVPAPVPNPAPIAPVVAPAPPEALASPAANERVEWAYDQADVREALEEARQAREESRREAEEARREAQADVREAQAEMRRAQMEAQGAARASRQAVAEEVRWNARCGQEKKARAFVAIRRDAGSSAQASTVICGSGMSDAEIARISLAAMINARKGLEHGMAMEPAQRAKALAAMDAEIVRLKNGGLPAQ